jgi:hypothetical protein
MDKGVLVLVKGVQIGTLYKLIGSSNLIGCNDIIFPEFDSTSTRFESIQTNSTSHHKVDSTMLWPERMGNIG